jgi:Cof subfamily protein (haloacid dehalogenase superfamily)
MTSLNNDISIVASDLDGTLLAPDHKISAHSKQTLKDLHSKGYTFVFATGRHHIDVEGIRELINIPAYMITSNGAQVHGADNQLMFKANVPETLVQAIIDLTKNDSSIFIHIYRDNEWLLNQEDHGLREYHNESGFTFKFFDADKAPTSGVAKIFMTHVDQNHDYLTILENKLNALFDDQLTIVFSTPSCLEIMGANVSKGHALKLVAESLGKTLDNCIAFGDGMNDLEMLTMAGKGLVMETAHDKLFQALPPRVLTIGSNADDAVANYLIQNLL